MNSLSIQNLIYLFAAVLFIYGLKGLSHPRTALKANLWSAFGMLLAVLVTLFSTHILSWKLIALSLLIGSVIGFYLAATVPMTGMPGMVALLNGFGGAASTLVGGGSVVAAIYHVSFGNSGSSIHLQTSLATALSGFIGSITFFGSLMAFMKLQEKVKTLSWGKRKLVLSSSIFIPGRHGLHLLIALLCGIFTLLMVLNPTVVDYFWALVVFSSLLGILITIPIGGADMPVVISLLNSYSGLAACATGFVINNSVLIITGSLVGASGIILTNIMCKAMNRSLINVMFARTGNVHSGPSQDEIYAGKIKSTTAEEIALLFEDAKRVVIVPGYGLAVSQAQHSVRDLASLLESKGIEVEFGIHPVAGRMPGHMNVLLAEADIPYEKLKEMDLINPTFEQTDVVLVVGANDVVNPMAKTDPKSPIAGMPILTVDKARTVVVVKRSLSPGFAGIPNPLFANSNTLMFFNDGKKAFLEIIAAIKENS